MERYTKMCEIGKGATSTVYKAYDKISNRVVALKSSYDRMLIQKEYYFLREMDMTGIPKAYDYFEDGEKYVLVMEYIPGKSLQKLLKERCDERKMYSVMVELGGIISYLHDEKEIFYLDLKPANVIVAGRKVYLVDYGSIQQKKTIDGNKNVTLSGTKKYAAPEQCVRGKTVSEKSDIYGYGMLITEIAKKCGTNNKSIITISKRCCCRNPEKRYASMREVISLLSYATRYVGTVYRKKVQ